MAIRFERQSLYEEVWMTPLTKLGIKYGLSDNGIRKICKALNIPLPKGGHWAKVAAGKKVHRIPLPPQADRTEFISDPVSYTQPTLDQEDEQWLNERLAFESLPENAIPVEERPARWHPVVLPLVKRLQSAVKDAHTWERQARVPDNTRARGPHLWLDKNSYLWDSFTANGRILDLGHKSPLRVSINTWERAVAILNACLQAAKSRGFEVDYHESRPRLSIKGGSVYLRLAEELVDDVARKRKDGGGTIPKRPTGRLRIHIGSGWYSEYRIEDRRDSPLESRLGEVFKTAYRKVAKERAEEREREAERKREAERERQRQRAEAIRQADQRQREKERARRGALLEECAAWQRASQLRAYVKHIEAAATEGQRAGELRGWIEWALQVAVELDPTAARLNDQSTASH